MIILDLTLDFAPVRPYTRRSVDSLKQIVVHHSAGSSAQTPRQIRDFHVNGRGWVNIGYNYLVYQDGRVFKVRPLSVVPSCVEGHNTESLCICFVGNFSKTRPFHRALRAGAELIQLLKKAYPGVAAVKRHSDLDETECPGKRFPFDELMTMVADNGEGA